MSRIFVFFAFLFYIPAALSLRGGLGFQDQASVSGRQTAGITEGPAGNKQAVDADHFTFRMAVSSTENKDGKNYPDNSVLRSGTWIKIKTTRDGIYRLTYEDLVQMGVESPASVRIFGNGNRMLPKMNSELRYTDLIENCIYFHKSSEDTFNPGDYILFYGQGPVTWQYQESSGMFEHERHLYSDGSYYFITSSASGKEPIQISPATEQPADVIVEEFDDYLFHESDLVNLLKSGRSWQGENFRMITERDFTFTLPGIMNRKVRMKWKTTVRSPVSSSFTVGYNNVSLSRMDFQSVNTGSTVAPFALEGEDITEFFASNDKITLKLSFEKNSDSAEGWLNYLLLNTRRSLSMTGSQMHFRDRESAGEEKVAEFRISNVPPGTRVWDITDPLEISEVNTTRSEGNIIFRDTTSQMKQYIAFDGGNYLEPEIIGIIGNQNLHGIRHADMVIVTHPLFLQEANRLALHRQNNDLLDVVVVTPSEMYNEFSSGKPDVTAIRDFMKMLYDRAEAGPAKPRYLLLFGKGSYDNRPGDPSGTNFVPTYQSPYSLRPTQSFVSDDFFGLLDEGEGEYTGDLNIGIGRIPVSTPEQAKAVVDKIIGYNNTVSKGDWQNMLSFIADDGDNNLHMRDADILAGDIKINYPSFNIEKIYLDAWPKTGTALGQRYPGVNDAISERIRKGVLILNYTGHGNELRLADENIIDINDVMSWTNKDRLPVFMTATCEFSRFDNPERVSAGEMLLLNPTGGGIALFSTTRLVYAAPNFFLNRNFYRFILEKDLRLGDVMRLTKNNSGSGINKRNFTLLGDPSMKLAIPEHNIIYTSINGDPVTEIPDTLKALSRVTISGMIVDNNGLILDDFNGVVYNTVFDKTHVVQTLGNDGNTPFSFETRNNIIYKGKSNASEGKFNFSFMVPRDIAYHYGKGKISSFATDGSTDASGFFSNMIVGGSDPDHPADSKGPAIELYMNDRRFVSGGLTDQNPRLLAYLFDESGINTTGTGIGHDITMMINNDPSTLVVLNDYYTAEADSYQRGTIEYPFSNLPQGQYDLTLKAWDVYNNSSEASIRFNVSEAGGLIINNVINYPNPFAEHTSFIFEHNQPGSEMEVMIQVFTISGHLVKTIRTSMNTAGYRSNPIYWDGQNDNGGRLASGIYIYRLMLKTEKGFSVEKYRKLLILK